jgi:hypothetical protein
MTRRHLPSGSQRCATAPYRDTLLAVCISGSVRITRGEVPHRIGTARSRKQKAVFGAVSPASAESKVGSALDSGLSSYCATTSPNDCRGRGTVNTAIVGRRQQARHCRR